MTSQPSNGRFSSRISSPNGGPLILSVDDEPVILLTREKILEAAGYEVLSANDGEHALRLFAEQPVKLVLLDFKMPGMDGGMVAYEMKRTKPGVPVLMVTASIVPDELLACVNCRIDKGNGPVLLLEKVAEYLTVVADSHSSHSRRAPRRTDVPRSQSSGSIDGSQESPFS